MGVWGIEFKEKEQKLAWALNARGYGHVITNYAWLLLHSQLQVDLVTETDKACEDLIFNHLKDRYPTHKVDS